MCVCVQAALQELEELKQIVPKESLVYFLIGKVSVTFDLFLSSETLSSLKAVQVCREIKQLVRAILGATVSP